MSGRHPGPRSRRTARWTTSAGNASPVLARAFGVFLIAAFTLAGCQLPPPGTSAPTAPPAPVGQAILGWGGNSVGQIGDGSTQQRLTPSLVGLPDIKAIAAGGTYSLALTLDGRVFEWGGGRSAPAEVAGLSAVKQIAVGDHHRLALKSDGTVVAWGDNDHGQLGDGSNSPRATPVQVVGLTGVLSVAAGASHSLAIGSDFGVWSWGANTDGQLGDGSTTDRLTPVAVTGIKAIELAAGATHTLALTTDLTLQGWGNNAECQLGADPREVFDPIVCSDHLLPTAILGLGGPPRPSSEGGAIAATTYSSFVVLSSGTVYGLGGQGDPTTGQFRGMCNTDLAIGGPAALNSLSGVEEVSSGSDHALFRTAGGEVWSLGTNSAGQLGVGTASIQECPQPVPVSAVRGVTQVAAGSEHSLALIAGVLSTSPGSVDFGSQPISSGSATPVQVTIANTGLAPMSFYDISVSGDYSITDDCPDRPSILAPAATCTITVTFTPTVAGQHNGRINLAYDGLARQQELALSGVGTEAHVVFTAASLDFGTQTTGTASAPKVVTIQNDGLAPLLIDSISATAGFAIATSTLATNCPTAPANVASQATCTVEVTFTPNVAGDAIGELRVNYQPGKLVTMPLKGTGN